MTSRLCGFKITTVHAGTLAHTGALARGVALCARGVVVRGKACEPSLPLQSRPPNWLSFLISQLHAQQHTTRPNGQLVTRCP